MDAGARHPRHVNGPEATCAAFLKAAARLSSAPGTRRRPRGRGWGVWVTALAAAAGCAKQPFPPGWLYVTRVDRTAATVVWTGPGSRVTCRGSDGSGTDASGTLHDRGLRAARLETLRPDTMYACRVVDADGRRVTRVRFRTAPAPGVPFLFTVVGDSGHGGPVGRAIARRIRAAHPAFLAHVGDFAYTHGTVGEYARYFFGPYEPTLRRVPLFPTPGNHDLYARSV